MKKLSTVFLSAMLVLTFAACNANSSSSEPAPAPVPKDYTQILLDARDKETNEAFAIIGKSEDGTFTFTHNPNKIEDSDVKNNVDMTLEIVGVTQDQIDDLALSTSLMNVKAYGVAIIKPTEGNQEAVFEAINKYWELQKQSFEMYLPDQYEITKVAKLELMETGEIVFVMCQDSDELFETIKTELSK